MSRDKPGKWGGSGKWGSGKPRDDAGKTKPSRLEPPRSVPPVAKPRVSVAQPQRSIAVGRPLSTASRAAAERDARVGWLVIFGVLAITVLVFGTNYAGFWKSPGQQQPTGQQQVRPQSERRSAPAVEVVEKQRIALGRSEAKDDAVARRTRGEADQTARENLTGLGDKP